MSILEAAVTANATSSHSPPTAMCWVGLALMLYPYAVWQTWLLYVVGAGLSIAAWLDRP